MLLLNSFFRPFLPSGRIKWIMGFLILLPAFLSAQMRTITGIVKNESGTPLPGVSVVVKGQHVGTETDAAGHFLLNASRGTKLVFSAVGNETREQMIGQSDNYEIFLKPAASDLGDVVVIGYGSQKKVNLTGSVSTISSKELESRPVTNISSALAGLSPGMYVSQGSGTPGKMAPVSPSGG